MRLWLKPYAGIGPESNPASLTGRREEAPSAHLVPAPTAVAALMTWLLVSDPALMLLVRLAATTGARRGELLGLWRDVDLERGRVRLVHGLVDGAEGPVLQFRKTRNANSWTSTQKHLNFYVCIEIKRSGGPASLAS